MAYIGVQPTDTYLSIASQQITGNGGATYTLNYSVSDEESVAVFVNNVRQNVSSYTVSGTSLTLGGTISASDECWVLFLGRTVGTKNPAVGSVTNDMLAGSINESKLLGSIPNSKLANSSVTVNGTSIDLGASGTISAGITMADSWRLTTNFTDDANPIASNLERVDTDGFGQLGTGMTESSGIFTFPSTGIYYITFLCTLSANGADIPYHLAGIQTTTDGSTYSNATEPYQQVYASSLAYASLFSSFIFDVTNTTTHKVRFRINASSSSTTTEGDSNSTLTGMNFIRLGDT